jgi:hypothetical protein
MQVHISAVAQNAQQESLATIKSEKSDHESAAPDSECGAAQSIPIRNLSSAWGHRQGFPGGSLRTALPAKGTPPAQ